MQTKKKSLAEAVTNTAVGFGISLAATFIIFPLLGIESSAGKNVLITLFFTVISILRGYVLRRFFNRKSQVKVKELTGEWWHCFSCEIEMPVVKNEQGYYCKNCGLRHHITKKVYSKPQEAQCKHENRTQHYSDVFGPYQSCLDCKRDLK